MGFSWSGLRGSLIGLVLAGSTLGFATVAHAQFGREADEALDELAQILGALAHLEAVCDEPELARGDMQALLELDELNPVREAVMVDAYNRGFRGVANSHRSCNASSERLIERHQARGADLVAIILGEQSRNAEENR